MTPQKRIKRRLLSRQQRQSELRSHLKQQLQSEEMCNSIAGVLAGRHHFQKTSRTESKRQKAPKVMGRAQACSFESFQMLKSLGKARWLLALAQHPAKTALSSSNRVRAKRCRKKHMKN